MKQTVAAYIAKTLEQAGVKRIWGVTGDSLNGLSDSLNKMKTIEWMPTRHEEVAAFAAGAEAQLTGELAVCAGSCGPGNLHLINGLFDCHRNHVPVLAIAAAALAMALIDLMRKSPEPTASTAQKEEFEDGI